MPRRYLSSILRKDKPCWKPEQHIQFTFCSNPSVKSNTVVRSFNQGLCPIFSNSSATHLFIMPDLSDPIYSKRNHIFWQWCFFKHCTARPLIASNRVYNPRYSGKCIASHLWILFADMLCCFMILSRLYTRSLISA